MVSSNYTNETNNMLFEILMTANIAHLKDNKATENIHVIKWVKFIITNTQNSDLECLFAVVYFK